MSMLQHYRCVLYHQLLSQGTESNWERKPSMINILCLTFSGLIKCPLFNDCSVAMSFTDLSHVLWKPIQIPFVTCSFFTQHLFHSTQIFAIFFSCSHFFCSLSFHIDEITYFFTTQAIYFLLCSHFWLVCAPKDRSQVTRFTKGFHSGYLVLLMTDFIDLLTSRVESPSLDR